jgi:hypothetical protein
VRTGPAVSSVPYQPAAGLRAEIERRRTFAIISHTPILACEAGRATPSQRPALNHGFLSNIGASLVTIGDTESHPEPAHLCTHERTQTGLRRRSEIVYAAVKIDGDLRRLAESKSRKTPPQAR